MGNSLPVIVGNIKPVLTIDFCFS